MDLAVRGENCLEDSKVPGLSEEATYSIENSLFSTRLA